MGMPTQCKPITIGCATITQYNEHNPHDFVITLQKYDEVKLYDMCKDMIWLSAFAANNPGSDFHWMCDACYAECTRRGKSDLYQKAHKYISGSV